MYSFSARQRLRDKAEFDHVYRSGQRYSQSLFQAAACRNAHGAARLGLAIAARSVGNSVARNRIRRLVREAFRLCQHELPACDIVVSARPRARSAGAAELRADIARLFAALSAKCERY